MLPRMLHPNLDATSGQHGATSVQHVMLPQTDSFDQAMFGNKVNSYQEYKPHLLDPQDCTLNAIMVYRANQAPLPVHAAVNLIIPTDPKSKRGASPQSERSSAVSLVAWLPRSRESGNESPCCQWNVDTGTTQRGPSWLCCAPRPMGVRRQIVARRNRV
jgi:hypothetical protein